MMSKRGLLQQKQSLKKNYIWCAPSSFQGAAILTSRIRPNRSKDKKRLREQFRVVCASGTQPSSEVGVRHQGQPMFEMCWRGAYIF